MISSASPSPRDRHATPEVGARRIGSTAIALLMVCLPSLLVFTSRWLGVELFDDLLAALWCRVPGACLGGWPPTMVLIVPAALAGVVLAARHSAASGPAIEPLPVLASGPSTDDRRRRPAAAALAASAAALVGVLAFHIASATRPAWDYAIVYLVFLASWMALEVPGASIQAAVDWLHRWTPALGTHLSLVAAIWLAVERRPLAPLLVVLTLAAHILLWRSRRAAIPPVFWLVSLSLVVTSLYFDAWWFSAIGDEYAFYDFAVRLAASDAAAIGRELYNPAGVYGAHPGVSSLLQAAGIAVFGDSLFGWRFVSLYLAALSLVPYRAFVETIGGRRLALLAAALLAVSHYVMSFGKIGYNNLQALFAFSVCLAAAAWFTRSRGRLAAVAFGAALGLSFFVYPGALLTVPAALAAAGGSVRRRASLKRWLIVALVLLATCLPLLVQGEFWASKAAGTLWQNPVVAADGSRAAPVFLRNLGQASLAFLFLSGESHFVAVGLVDVVSAALVLLGLGVLLRSAARRTALRLLLGLVSLLALVGGLHGYDNPPLTRMFLLLPWLALLGALGCRWLEGALRKSGASERAAQRTTYALLGLILVANLIQAYPLSRLRMAGRYQSPQVLLLREADNLLEPGPDAARLLILALPDAPLRASLIRQLRLHRVPFDPHRIDELNAGQVPAADLKDPGAIVLIAPRVEDPLLAQLESRLRAAGKTACSFRSSIGEVRLVVWLVAQERYRCAEAAYRW